MAELMVLLTIFFIVMLALWVRSEIKKNNAPRRHSPPKKGSKS